MGDSYRILIIDDDTVDRMAIARALRRSAIAAEIDEAEDGVVGMQTLLNARPDCTFLDYRLPPTDGLTVLRQARAAGYDAPIVMLTGEGDEQLAAAVMRAGASDYLSKSNLSTENLVRSIKYVTRVHSAEAAQQRLASFPEQAPNPILEADRHGIITYLNPAAAEIFVDLIERGAEHPILYSWDTVAASLLSGDSRVITREVMVDGSYFHQTISPVADRELLRIYAIDITDRKKAEEQLIRSAFFDLLTELPNRALFVDRLGRAMERAKRHSGYKFAVLYLDLDRFKVINDSLGHHHGNQVIVAVADRLLTSCRPEDTVSRFGGDEFAILMDGPDDIAHVTHAAEAVLKQFVSPFQLDGRDVFTSVSIGVALSNGGYSTPDELLRDADIAMYRAKAQGGARFQVFDTDMHAQAVTLLQMETELRHALERDELCLFYQPIIATGTGRLAGLEALVRWRHPRLGLIGPADFLPLAEETGIIVDVDLWVLRNAFGRLAGWRQQFGIEKVPHVCVNISSPLLEKGDLLGQIHRLAGSSCAPGGSLDLVLEITETTIMEHIDLAVDLLSKLKPMGVSVSVDDFGTGYSSLSYLRRLPIDTLKIDRSFVRDVHTDKENLEIVRVIIDLARSLGLEVVAEGIESREQFERIRDLKGDYGQGYWFSRPVDAEAAEAFIDPDRQWV